MSNESPAVVLVSEGEARTTFTEGADASASGAVMVGGRDDGDDARHLTMRKDFMGQYRLATETTLCRGPNMDAFGRLRVSQAHTVFAVRFIHDALPTLLDQDLTGSATITRNTNESSMQLATTTASGDKAILQSYRTFPYRPGKSTLSVFSFNLEGSDTNVRKRLGLFDANNGFFLELAGTTLGFVIRTKASGSVVDNKINQTNWNVDKLDGTGPSGATIDLTKTNLFWFDFQWLGVGTVRFGVVVDGQFIVCHQEHHANDLTVVYLRDPNLPVRWEIENTGTASGTPTLTAICCNISIENGIESSGLQRSIDRGVTGITTNDTLRPVISMRLRSGYLSAVIRILAVSIVSTTESTYRWALYVGPTITGGTAASWTTLADSAIEYDTARTGTVSAGRQLISGYGTKTTAPTVNAESIEALGVAIDGTPQEMVLAVQNVSNPNETFFGGLHFVEII
jgi:hypothetical protein